VEAGSREGRVEVYGEKMRVEIREDDSYTWGQHVSEKTVIPVGVITFLVHQTVLGCKIDRNYILRVPILRTGS
jgi:hypothetical protein